MKRIIPFIAALALSMGVFAGPAQANAEGNKVEPQRSHMQPDHVWKQLAPYQDKLHEMNRLKIQYYELKQEALLKKDSLLRLHSSNKKPQPGAWKQNPQMKQNHQKMKQICQEMRALRGKMKMEKKNLHMALRAKDTKKIGAHLDQTLLLQKQVNQKLAERNAVLDSIAKEMKK